MDKAEIVNCLEVTIHAAKDLPGLNRDKKTIDPYVLLWLTSEESGKKFRASKSKQHEKNNNPIINETFLFKIPKEKITPTGINDTLQVRWHNYKTGIGKQEVAPAHQVSLQGIILNAETEPEIRTVEIGPGCGSYTISFDFYSCTADAAPVPAVTHTGGGSEKFVNSITRTEVKQRVRKGDRGSDIVVEYLTVKVHEATGLRATGSTTSPYFFINLNSSKQVQYKGKQQSNTVTPVWEQEFGFETALVIRDVIKDFCVINVVGYNAPLKPAHKLGSVHIPLDTIKKGGTVSDWYPLVGDGSLPGSKIRVTLQRTKKAVCDLENQATSLLASMNKRLIWVLGSARKILTAMGMAGTLSVSLKAAVAEVRFSIRMDPSSVDHEKIARDAAEAENAMDQQELVDEGSDQVIVVAQQGTPEEAPQKDPGIFKSMVISAIQKLAKNMRETSMTFANLGLTGTVGSSIIIGVAMYGCELEIGVDLEVGAGALGGEGFALGTESQLNRRERRITNNESS